MSPTGTSRAGPRKAAGPGDERARQLGRGQLGLRGRVGRPRASGPRQGGEQKLAAMHAAGLEAGGKILSQGEAGGAMLEHAHELLDRARRMILGYVERGFEVETKEDGSFVTAVDREVEQMLRAGLEEAFPEHGIVGEEFPPHNPAADYLWYIDPIDGTHSFCAGIPLYGTILALHYRGRPELGLIDLPALGERYSASKGMGTWLNGKAVQVAEGLGEPIIATADRAQFQRVGREGAYDRITLRFPHTRAYSDCFGHAMAIRGSVGAMADFGVRAWDIAATRILVEEAGGRYEVVHQDGDRFSVVFGRPAVVQELLTCA